MYYKLAADRNNWIAQFGYGLCLQFGKGVSIDLVNAARHYRLAADQGLCSAQFAYGSRLECGHGVAVDLVEAVKYYRLAADQDLADAQFRYAVCLEHGKGAAMDFCGAKKYYKLAAHHNDVKARFLCVLRSVEGSLFRGDRGGSARRLRLIEGVYGTVDANSGDRSDQCQSLFPLHRTIGCTLFMQGITGGYLGMLNGLGRSFETGSHVEKDLALAAECYSQAAERNPQAQRNYGFCLEHGLGVERDASKAIEFCEKSLLGGNAGGSRQYALWLHFGREFCEDLEAAAEHYDCAVGKKCQSDTQDQSRCFRTLNQKKRLRVPRAEVEMMKAGPLDQRSIEFIIPDSIAAYRVKSITGGRGELLG
jgi:TPR repeat protein